MIVRILNILFTLLGHAYFYDYTYSMIQKIFDDTYNWFLSIFERGKGNPEASMPKTMINSQKLEACLRACEGTQSLWACVHRGLPVEVLSHTKLPTGDFTRRLLHETAFLRQY